MDDVKRYRARLEALRSERSSWLPHWRELSEHILPRSSRYLEDTPNDGRKKHQRIINGRATKAARILASGMMSGLTSPARPWFRLALPDADLSEHGPVREWLDAVERRLSTALAKSNVYNVLHGSYLDLGVIGTAPFRLEPDDEDGLRAYGMPPGQYLLANSARLAVDTAYRELSMTVGQLVQQFGLEACSPHVRNLWEQKRPDAWVKVVHVVEPNLDMQHGRADAAGMPWRSVWFEASGNEDKFLRISGAHENPVMAPRWDLSGEDVYGSSPAMDALGDIKALQLLERRKAQAADKIINPPMVGPQALQNHRASLLPGDVTYLPDNAAGARFMPAMEVPYQAVQVLELSVREHEARIDSAFYADLWLSLTSTSRTQITAREVAERHEEKMLQLGPVLERLQDELLDPLVDRAFGILLRSGQLPEPPEEIQGQDLRVEYVSILSQAQKLIGTTGVERLAGFVAQTAQVDPGVLDLVDTEAMVRGYADMLGTPATMLRDADEVAQLRAQRAAQEQAQQQGAAMLAATEGARNLAQADTSGDNALTRMLAGLGGVAPPAGGVQ